MKFILGLIRFILFALVSVTMISYFLLSGIILGCSTERGFRLRARFIRIMLLILNVQIRYFGKLPAKGFTGFIVANHRSYFDPIAILRDIDAVTVAKSQVSNWPIVGLGAKLVGVIWVNRDDKDSRRATRDKMAKQIKSGYNVMIFPEGTSHTAEEMLQVRNATFVMAAESGIPVLPVAIDYKHKADAWVGDDTFVRHFFECFGKWKTEVGVYYANSIAMDDAEVLKGFVVSEINSNVKTIRAEIGYVG